jgi:hypothetical protein
MGKQSLAGANVRKLVAVGVKELGRAFAGW